MTGMPSFAAMLRHECSCFPKFHHVISAKHPPGTANMFPVGLSLVSNPKPCPCAFPNHIPFELRNTRADLQQQAAGGV